MTKILVIALGGTIGSVKTDSISLDKNSFKILDYVKDGGVEFSTLSPFAVLSENIDAALWKKLIACIDDAKIAQYDGVIILHGSDTLSFTSALIGNSYPNEKIVLIAADKPLEDKKSNGIKNFKAAVEIIKNKKISHPMTVYDGIFDALAITGADVEDKFRSVLPPPTPLGKKNISDKSILIVKVYPGFDANNYNFANTDGVIFTMYHSATVPNGVKDALKTLDNQKIPYRFVTHRQSADYETAKDLEKIEFSTTIENAYISFILK